MLPKGAFLKVVDNSGARLAQVIWTRFKYASVGNVVKVTVKEAKGGKVAAGQMKKAVITEAKYPQRRKNGSHIQFLRNACVLLSDKGVPLGNRFRTLLTYEFLRPRWQKISALGKQLY